MAAKRPLVHSGGSFVELPDADSVRLGEQAIAAGATSPNPGAKVIVWSTTESAWIGWNGTAWALVSPPGGSVAFTSLTDGPGSFTGNAFKVPIVNAGATALRYSKVPVVYDVDFIIPYIETNQYFNETDVWSPSSGVTTTTINLTSHVFTAGGLSAPDIPGLGSTVCIQGSGIYEITDVTTPSAAVLTRVPEFPTGHVIDYPLTVRSRQKFNVLRAKAVNRATTGGFPVTSTTVNVAGNKITLSLDALYGTVHYRTMFSTASDQKTAFILTNFSGGTVPTGLTDGAVYWPKVVDEPTGGWNLGVRLYTDASWTTPAVITATAGTDDCLLVPITYFDGETVGVTEVVINEAVTDTGITIGTDSFRGRLAVTPTNSGLSRLQGLMEHPNIQDFSMETLDFGSGSHVAVSGNVDTYTYSPSGDNSYLVPSSSHVSLRLEGFSAPVSPGYSPASNNWTEHALAVPTISLIPLGFYSPDYASDPWPLEIRYRVQSTELLSGTFRVLLHEDRRNFYSSLLSFG